MQLRLNWLYTVRLKYLEPLLIEVKVTSDEDWYILREQDATLVISPAA